MVKKNRKRLSALLDDPQVAPTPPPAAATVAVAEPVEAVSTVETVENKGKTLKDTLSDGQADFVEFLAQEDPDMLEQMEEGDLELSCSEDEEEEGELDERQLDDMIEEELKEQDKDDLYMDFSGGEEDDEEDSGNVVDDDDEIDVHAVTESKIAEWVTLIRKDEPKGLTHLSRALYAALIAIDDREPATADKERVEREKSRMVGRVSATQAIFPTICSAVMQHVPLYLVRTFDLTKNSKPGEVSQHAAWKTCKDGLKVLLAALPPLVERLLEVETQKQLLTMVRALIIFFIAMPGARKPCLKMATKLWSQSNDETLRVQAFLIIYKLLKFRPEMLDAALRSMYLNYVANAKFIVPSTLPNVYFMQRSLVELYALDGAVAYQHGFLYTRQLAIQLRKALTNPNPNTVQSVANWQFVSALQLWCKVVSAEEQLAQLHLPLVQIIFGVFEMISSSPRLAPLSFHMLRSCLLLCGPEAPYVPLWAPIMEILTHVPAKKGDIGHRSKETLTEEDMKSRLPDMQMIVKLQNAHCKHRHLPAKMIEEFEELVLTYATALSHKIDYPELTLLPRKKIKEYAKNSKNNHTRKQLRILLEHLNANATFVEAKRATVDFGPADSAKIEEFERAILDETPPPLHRVLEKFKKTRMRERMSEAQATLPLANDKSKMGGVESFNRFYDTEAGQALRKDDRDEFPELFEKDEDEDSEMDDREVEEEVKEEVVEVEESDPRETIAKSEQLKLRKIKGTKDQVTELDLADW